MVAKDGEIRGGNIRARKIELVLDAVEGTVADQDEYKIVVRFRLARDFAERLSQISASRVLPGQRIDVDIAA